MKQQIRGSDVYVVEDIERILVALAGATRRYSGEYGAGYMDALRDVAAGVGGRVDAPQMERIHEVTEYRHERTVERYAQPPAVPAERQFKIVGEREALPAPPIALARPEPVNMTGDDVNVTVFNPAYGRLVTREIGHAWFGNDGTTTYWNASDWQRVPPEEYERWGEALPEGWAVLVRHAYANAKRRQLAAPHASRITHHDRRLLR